MSVEKYLMENNIHGIKNNELNYKEFNQSPFDDPSEEFKEYINSVSLRKSRKLEDENELSEIIELQKKVLYLNEIQKQENKALYDKIIGESSRKKIKALRDFGSKNSLKHHVVAFESIKRDIFDCVEFQDIVKKVNSEIEKTDIESNLKSSGYSDDIIKEIAKDKETSFQLKFQKKFIEDIVLHNGTDIEKEKAVNQSLRENKSVILGFLNSPSTKLAMTTVGFTMACIGGGGFPLLMAAPKMIDAIAKHEKVSALLSDLNHKIISAGDSLGVDFRPASRFVGEVKDLSQKFVDSKLFKAIGLCSLAVGCYAIYNNADKIIEACSSIGSDIKGSINELISNFTGVKPDAVENAANKISDMTNITLDTNVTTLVKKGDSAWKIAKEAYEAAEGKPATNEQIQKLIDSMDIKDPSKIKVGQVVKMDMSSVRDASNTNLVKHDIIHTNSNKIDLGSDVSNADAGEVAAKTKYSADSANIYINDLSDRISNAFRDAIKSDTTNLFKASETELKVDLGFLDEMYSKSGANNTESFIKIVREYNPDIKYSHNLYDPGRVINLPGGKFEMPDIRQMILEKAYGKDFPIYIDKVELLKQIGIDNNIDGLTGSTLGIDYVSSTTQIDLLKQISELENNTLKIRGIDLGKLINDDFKVDLSRQVGYKESSALEHRIFRAFKATSDAPDYVRVDFLIPEIMQANPELKALALEAKHIKKDSTSGKVIIGIAGAFGTYQIGKSLVEKVKSVFPNKDREMKTEKEQDSSLSM